MNKLIDGGDVFDKMAAEFIPSEKEIEEIELLSAKVLLEAEFPWEKALDTYDPNFPGYVPTEEAFEFFILMRVVHGQDFEVDNSIAHYFMVDLVLGNVTEDMYPYSKEVNAEIDINYDRLAICCSRGLSKSTILTNYLLIYVAIKGRLEKFGQQKFWLALGASSKGHARNMAISLRAVCENSKYLNEVMEYMRFTETEAEFLRKGTGSEENRYFCIRFMGIFTPTRGQKNKFNARPDAAILDDCLPSHAAAYSKTIMATLTTAIHSDLGNALKASGGRIINIFTPFNYTEPNTSSILNRSFTPLLIPVAKMFNEEDLKRSEIESSWPQMHTKDSVHRMWKLAKSSGTMKLFMQERMLRLTSGTDRLVPEDCIRFCDTTFIQDNIYAYNIYITTDFTTTSGESSDFSGAAVWALGNNGDWFMLDLVLRKMNMEEQYTTVLDWAARYKRMGKHVEIGVEVDGSQTAHIFSLEKIMMQRSDWYSFARQKGVDKDETRKGILSRKTGGSKIERFRVAVTQFMLPMKLWLPEHLKDTKDMKEFLDQVRGATHENFARSDDGPDLISMLNAMVVVQPTEVARGPKEKKISRSLFSDMDFDEHETENYSGSTVF